MRILKSQEVSNAPRPGGVRHVAEETVYELYTESVMVPRSGRGWQMTGEAVHELFSDSEQLQGLEEVAR